MKKVSKFKLASTYALALYEAAAGDRAEDSVFAEVKALRALIAEDASLLADLANPLWKGSAKKEALAAVAQKMKWSGDMLRCMDIIAENGRFAELALILEQFEHIYYQKHNLAEVRVETVQPLRADQEKKLREVLEKRLGQKTVIDYRVNEKLIGGLKITHGSDLIDDSVLSKLNRLENMMKGE